MKRLLASLLAVLPLLACDASGAETRPSGAEARSEGPAALESAGSAHGREGLIRNVRVTPAATTVRITFTGIPTAFATVVIGPTPPALVAVPAMLVEEGVPASVYIMDPERQVAGYLLRSRADAYALDTADQQPEEGSTNGPSTLRPGTLYHFIIGVPARAALAGEDEDDLPPGEQYVGTFTTPG